jgi:hypothetical protein
MLVSTMVKKRHDIKQDTYNAHADSDYPKSHMIQRYDVLTRERIKKGFHNMMQDELEGIS